MKTQVVLAAVLQEVWLDLVHVFVVLWSFHEG